MNPPAFTLLKTEARTSARRGLLHTRRGTVDTPVFMPVATQGSVKALSQQEVEALGFRLILANTYHLHVRPGEALIRAAGGLHGFMGWNGSVLTDSGGFQVFSLQGLRKIEEDGVRFQSHLNGDSLFFTPERVMEIQSDLDSDIWMAFDECPPYPCERQAMEESMARTHRWEARCRRRWRELEAERGQGCLLFGIVQGGVYPDLRAGSAAAVVELELPGNAIGGVSVGEPPEAVREIVAGTTPLLPADRPRYLMGVGMPEDILAAVGEGVDMFDCVLPTRLGRNGAAFTSRGRLNLKNARHRQDSAPLDPECDEWCCRNYSAAYVHHLYRANEILASRILTYHNLAFYARLMSEIRQAIEQDRFAAYRRQFLAKLEAADD